MENFLPCNNSISEKRRFEISGNQRAAMLKFQMERKSHRMLTKFFSPFGSLGEKFTEAMHGPNGRGGEHTFHLILEKILSYFSNIFYAII